MSDDWPEREIERQIRRLRWQWNALVWVGRLLSPGFVVLVVWQTQVTLADWRSDWLLLFPIQVWAIATNLRITYDSWFKDRLKMTCSNCGCDGMRHDGRCQCCGYNSPFAKRTKALTLDLEVADRAQIEAYVENLISAQESRSGTVH